jgi:hypothetical protein
VGVALGEEDRVKRSVLDGRVRVGSGGFELMPYSRIYVSLGTDHLVLDEVEGRAWVCPGGFLLSRGTWRWDPADGAEGREGR